MLTRLQVNGFKSLTSLDVRLPKLTVLLGPNAVGKSNVLEAAQLLSRIGTSRTLAEAFADPLRGHPLEAFGFPEGGLPDLLRKEQARLDLTAGVDSHGSQLEYRVSVGVQPSSGSLAVVDEFLTALTRKGEQKWTPAIELVGDRIRVRRKSKPAHPREEPVGGNHSQLSDTRFSGPEYPGIQACRDELQAWRVYYLDPRVAMRSARPPAEVDDIGPLGEAIGPYLHRLRAEHPKHFDAVRRALRSLIPAIEDLSVDLDERRGTLDIQVRQDGRDFSSRVISEGTLRVLALCSIAANPWARGLVAFEEPENGVHARRLELVARLLVSLATDQGRQVIVTTHSALFCASILRLTRDRRDDVAMLVVHRSREGTEVRELQYPDGLFGEPELTDALSSVSEDGVFEALLLRGLLDE